MIKYTERDLEIEEVRIQLIKKDRLKKLISRGTNVIVRGKKRNVSIGPDMLAKVISLVGLGVKNDRKEEIRKIETLAGLPYKPDILGDASVRNDKIPLYIDMLKIFDGPVSTNPTYCCFDNKKGIDENEFLETIEIQAEKGISYMVIHAAVTLDMYKRAKRDRKVPITSRGGSCIIKDMLLKGESKGIYLKIFPKILKIFKKYNIILSLGSTFRAASNRETFDRVHRDELKLQSKLIKQARNAGVRTILEVLTHARLDQIDEFRKITSRDKYLSKVPLNALGPLGTDQALGYDHANAAATAAYTSRNEGAHIFVVVTRVEHIGGIPKLEYLIEGLKEMRTSLHVANVAKFPSLEEKIGKQRDKDNSCMLTKGGLFPDESINKDKIGKCTRCGHLCPYLILKENK